MKHISKFSILSLLCILALACSNDHKPLNGGENISQFATLYSLQGSVKSRANIFKPVAISAQDLKPQLFEQAFQIGLQYPEKVDCNASVRFSRAAAESYIRSVNGDYQLLPEDLVQLPEAVLIPQGKMLSDPATLTLKVDKSLKVNVPYVFAIQLFAVDGVSSCISKSNNTLIYTVVRTVGQVEIKNVVHLYRTNYLAPEKAFPRSLPQGMSFECFVNVKQFHSPSDPGEAGISTLCGIEGVCLFRFGDAGIQPNHLQCCGQELDFDFLPNVWYHIAATITAEGLLTVYVNGQEKMSVPDKRAVLNSHNGWFIGRSWSDGRGINAQFAEFRVWSTVRTKTQIADGMYSVDPKTDGLLAYWKMNRAEGKKLNDETGNGYNLILKVQKHSADTPDGPRKADKNIVIDELSQAIDLEQ